MTPTIYEIKELTKKTAPYFFDKKSLKFWGQTMKSFKIYKQQDGRFLIQAKAHDIEGKPTITTTRYFNPKNNELERE